MRFFQVIRINNFGFYIHLEEFLDIYVKHLAYISIFYVYFSLFSLCQLSTKRPPRPDPERRNSRPASQFRSDQPLSVLNISASSLCSNTSTNTQGQ